MFFFVCFFVVFFVVVVLFFSIFYALSANIYIKVKFITKGLSDNFL